METMVLTKAKSILEVFVRNHNTTLEVEAWKIIQDALWTTEKENTTMTEKLAKAIELIDKSKRYGVFDEAAGELYTEMVTFLALFPKNKPIATEGKPDEM